MAAAAKKLRTEAQRARIAVAGAGWWAQGWHLPQLHRNPDVDLVAILEPCEAPRSTLNPDLLTREKLAAEYRVPVYATAREFFESDAVRASDGVIIAAPHAAHHDLGLQAIKAGLHVLMEKPMTTDSEEARELASAAAKSGKSFMVNNSANFREHAQKARELVASGAVGEVTHVQCYMGNALLWLFESPDNVGWVKPTGSMLGNGMAWGQLSHSLAWVYMVTGLAPESVTCQMVYSDKTGADLYDSAIVRCTNGATIAVQGVATLPFRGHEANKQIDNKIFGSEGVLTYGGIAADPTSGDLILQRHDGKDQTVSGFYFENTEASGVGPESIQQFIKACLGQPFVNGADATVGLRAVQTIEAMYRSAKSGKAEAAV